MTMKEVNSLVFAKSSKPTASRKRRLRIVELEDWLGVRSLEPSTRNLRPTDLGAEVLDMLGTALNLGEALDNIISN
jgi:hypothetical protein